MNDGSLIKNIAALTYLTADSDSPAHELAKKLWVGSLTVDVFQQLLDKVTGKSEIEKAQEIVILRIAQFVKDSPRATEAEKIQFIRAEFEKFSETIRNL